MTGVEAVQGFLQGAIGRVELERVLATGFHSPKLRHEIKVLVALDNHLRNAFETLPCSADAPATLRAEIARAGAQQLAKADAGYRDDELEKRLKSLSSLPVRTGAAERLGEQLRGRSDRDVRAASKPPSPDDQGQS